MDLTLTLSGQTIQSTLFEKPQNLYLYLPPHSSHPKGPLQSLIYGNILRIHRLCSSPREVHKHTRYFFHRLTNRGHNTTILTPLFRRATNNALTYMSCYRTNMTLTNRPNSPRLTIRSSSTSNTIHKTPQHGNSNKFGKRQLRHHPMTPHYCTYRTLTA
eukprot:CCRYP_018671-RB/>CCRYP_018671-RB protein AED:0.36 eAED:0.36 QI:0/-1/0/1/-1/0/1/0/158